MGAARPVLESEAARSLRIAACSARGTWCPYEGLSRRCSAATDRISGPLRAGRAGPPSRISSASDIIGVDSIVMAFETARVLSFFGGRERRSGALQRMITAPAARPRDRPPFQSRSRSHGGRCPRRSPHPVGQDMDDKDRKSAGRRVRPRKLTHRRGISRPAFQTISQMQRAQLLFTTNCAVESMADIVADKIEERA